MTRKATTTTTTTAHDKSLARTCLHREQHHDIAEAWILEPYNNLFLPRFLARYLLLLSFAGERNLPLRQKSRDNRDNQKEGLPVKTASSIPLSLP